MPVLVVEGFTGPPPRFLESESAEAPPWELSERRPTSGTEIFPRFVWGLSNRRPWSESGRLFCGATLMPPTFTLKSPAGAVEAVPTTPARSTKTISAYVARSSSLQIKGDRSGSAVSMPDETEQGSQPHSDGPKRAREGNVKLLDRRLASQRLDQPVLYPALSLPYAVATTPHLAGARR